MKTILGILIVVCLVFVGCGLESTVVSSDDKIKTVDDLKTWVINEIGLVAYEEAESRAKFDREVLNMISTREKSAYAWEDDVIERIEIMERTWRLANTHEIKQDEIIALLLDYLMLEVVDVPEVRSRIELKSTFIE